MTPQERLAEIEHIWTESDPRYLPYGEEEIEVHWLIARIKQLENTLNQVRKKTVTDPAHAVELRARASFIYYLVVRALRSEE